MQIETRRLQKVALLASRQEAEFVAGVLDAADVPHAIVEAASGFELRVDPDDVPRVRELIERLDVRSTLAEAARQRRGEALGRRIVLLAVLLMALGLAVGGAVWGGLISPGLILLVVVGVVLFAAGIATAIVVRGRFGGPRP